MEKRGRAEVLTGVERRGNDEARTGRSEGHWWPAWREGAPAASTEGRELVQGSNKDMCGRAATGRQGQKLGKLVLTSFSL